MRRNAAYGILTTAERQGHGVRGQIGMEHLIMRYGDYATVAVRARPAATTRHDPHCPTECRRRMCLDTPGANGPSTYIS